MRKLVTAVLTAGVATGVIGLTPAASAQTTDNTAFCDVALRVSDLINRETFQKLSPLLDEALTVAPPEIASNLQVVVPILKNALETEEDPSNDPAFEENNTAINEYVYNSCGWQQAEVTMLEYEFTGLPKSFTTGPVALKLVNTGAEVHEFVPLRIKTSDTLRKIIGLPEKKARKKVQFLGHELASGGETAYLFLDLKKAGRYGAVCFIPTGTTDLSQLEDDEHGGGGPPHAVEGMYESFKVTKASA